MKSNPLITKIQKGRILFGTWLTIPHPEVSEILSNLPFDWLVYDLEHTVIDYHTLELMLMPLNGSAIIPLVRIPWNSPVEVKKALDVGAKGIIVPYVNNRNEIELFIKSCKYPPRGIRGVGPRRAIKYGFDEIRSYYEKAENEILKIVMIETSEALLNLSDILMIEDLDGVFVGPYDLTASLGIFCNFDSEEYREALREIAEECRRRNKIAGIMVSDVNDALDKINMGYNFIALSSDIGLLIEGYRRILHKLGVV
jgi:2-keto-3-deoxy-L-rhamnonate aldolase RhmA